VLPKGFILAEPPQAVNRVPVNRDNLVRVLKGRVLVEGRLKLGNREDAQLMAIERTVGALVITGNLPVPDPRPSCKGYAPPGKKRLFQKRGMIFLMISLSHPQLSPQEEHSPPLRDTKIDSKCDSKTSG
jgi:hypothetical protein